MLGGSRPHWRICDKCRKSKSRCAHKRLVLPSLGADGEAAASNPILEYSRPQQPNGKEKLDAARTGRARKIGGLTGIAKNGVKHRAKRRRLDLGEDELGSEDESDGRGRGNGGKERVGGKAGEKDCGGKGLDADVQDDGDDGIQDCIVVRPRGNPTISARQRLPPLEPELERVPVLTAQTSITSAPAIEQSEHVYQTTCNGFANHPISPALLGVTLDETPPSETLSRRVTKTPRAETDPATGENTHFIKPQASMKGKGNLLEWEIMESDDEGGGDGGGRMLDVALQPRYALELSLPTTAVAAAEQRSVQEHSPLPCDQPDKASVRFIGTRLPAHSVECPLPTPQETSSVASNTAVISEPHASASTAITSHSSRETTVDMLKEITLDLPTESLAHKDCRSQETSGGPTAPLVAEIDSSTPDMITANVRSRVPNPFIYHHYPQSPPPDISRLSPTHRASIERWKIRGRLGSRFSGPVKFTSLNENLPVSANGLVLIPQRMRNELLRKERIARRQASPEL